MQNNKKFKELVANYQKHIDGYSSESKKEEFKKENKSFNLSILCILLITIPIVYFSLFVCVDYPLVMRLIPTVLLIFLIVPHFFETLYDFWKTMLFTDKKIEKEIKKHIYTGDLNEIFDISDSQTNLLLQKYKMNMLSELNSLSGISGKTIFYILKHFKLVKIAKIIEEEEEQKKKTLFENKDVNSMLEELDMFEKIKYIQYYKEAYLDSEKELTRLLSIKIDRDLPFNEQERIENSLSKEIKSRKLLLETNKKEYFIRLDLKEKETESKGGN